MDLYRIVGVNMIDTLILYFKHFPSLLHLAKAKVKETWKYDVILFLIQLIIISIIIGVMYLFNTEEIEKAQWIYRMIAFYTFVTIAYIIYKSFKLYNYDYLIAKSFQLTPIITPILNALIGAIIICVLSLITSIFKPVNLETSVISFVYFILMSIIFIVFISITLGLLTLISKKVFKFYVIAIIVLFFLVPIIFIPNNKANMIDQILKINPLYYLIDGLSSSIVFGAVNMYNIVYHIYFIAFLVLIGVINFILTRLVAHKKYEYF